MNCKISCSFGEVIDKKTILKLKLQHATTESQMKHISFELNTIQSEIPLSTQKDPLFDQLYTINSQLWNLEDNIRHKSKLHQFDKQYIYYAENIHRINDLRANIKKKINLKYNSNIIEEKIYNKIDNELDRTLLKYIKNEYAIGNYISSNSKIQPLLDKYKHTDIKNLFIADLYISYDNICNILNINNIYFHTLEIIINTIQSYTSYKEFIVFMYKIYCTSLLRKQKYEKADKYINYYNYIPALGPDMSFFKKDDTHKTLFIYDNGGIGDILMFGRILFELCTTYKNNKIKLLVNFKKISWLVDTLFTSIPNITFVYTSNKHTIGHFDYHCCLFKVFYFMNYKTYEDILFIPYLNDLSLTIEDKHSTIIDTLMKSNKKSYIFNWHGNKANIHEKNNRRMELIYAIPLFKLNNINWIITSKDITNEEYTILNTYDNIIILNDKIPHYDEEKSFYDTMIILKHVNGVISTDTSLVHLSLTMDIPTYVLLTTGSEWRWSNNSTQTNWYPNATLIRQKKIYNWDNVISTLTHMLLT